MAKQPAASSPIERATLAAAPSLLDRAILAVSPGWAASRAHSRLRVAAYGNAYEAVNHSRLRKHQKDFGSGNTTAGLAHKQLRDLARNLDRNHDISRGVLNTLVRNVVGPEGIGVQPQPRDASGLTQRAVTSELNAIWRADVLPFCQSALNNRYPFDPQSAVDVNVRDFARLFGPGGMIDAFINDHSSDAFAASMNNISNTVLVSGRTM